MFYVYILFSPSTGKYYVGQTDDLENRLVRHNRGYEKSTSKYVPWVLVWQTTKSSRGEALVLELKLKNVKNTAAKFY